MKEIFEQEEDEGEFDAQTAEREESRRLDGVAKEVDETVSFPILGPLQLITSLFNRPAKRVETPEKENRHERK